MGVIKAVCTSSQKGVRKKNVGSAVLLSDLGVKNDAHAGPGHRQVSLLAMESIRKMTDKGFNIGPGDFAENITTEGIDLISIPVGTKLRIGAECMGEVTQIGKECHGKCAIYKEAGDCVMPREGIFVKVLSGGEIKIGDEIQVVE